MQDIFAIKPRPSVNSSLDYPALVAIVLKVIVCVEGAQLRVVGEWVSRGGM